MKAVSYVKSTPVRLRDSKALNLTQRPLTGLMWCKFGHVAFETSRQRNPCSPPFTVHTVEHGPFIKSQLASIITDD